MPASTPSYPGTRLFAVAVLPALLAAAAPAPQESTPNEPLPSGLEERIEVNLVTLDFLATGKGGQPITDLQPDEVRILDGGRTMRLAFLERAEDPPPWADRPVPPAVVDFQFGDASRELTPPRGRRPRWILFVLDRYNIGPDTRNRAITAAQRFLGESWRPGDRGGLAVYDTALRFVLDGVFTTDPSLVSMAISDPDRFQPDPNFDRARELRDFMRELNSCRQGTPVRPCALHLARRYVHQRVQEAEDFLESLELAVRVLGTVPGRKYLVLFSNGFSVQPGAEAANALEAVFGAEQVRGVHMELLWDVGRSLDDFVETAARHRVTLFAIDTRRKPSGMLNAAQGALSNDRGAPVDPFLAELRDARATLTELAEGTGGRHFIGLDAADELAEAFHAAAGLYTAGYYLDDPDPRDWRRKVEVRVDRPGVRTTHRDHYRVIVPTPPPLRAGLVPGTPHQVSDLRVELPMTLQLDPATLPFHIGGGRAVSQVTVHLALHDQEGTPVAEAFHFLALEYPEQPFRRKAINPPRYQGILAAPPGHYLLKAHLVEPGRGGVIAFQVPVDLVAPSPDTVDDPSTAASAPPEGGSGP